MSRLSPFLSRGGRRPTKGAMDVWSRPHRTSVVIYPQIVGVYGRGGLIRVVIGIGGNSRGGTAGLVARRRSHGFDGTLSVWGIKIKMQSHGRRQRYVRSSPTWHNELPRRGEAVPLPDWVAWGCRPEPGLANGFTRLAYIWEPSPNSEVEP